MTKQQILETIKLLSALESWWFSNGQRMPDYLHDDLQRVVDELSKDLLK